MTFRPISVPTFVAILAFVLSAGSAEAQLFGGGCGQGDRPCGPGGLLNVLIPQGFLGADFRPACRRHDACYLNHYTGRYECDVRFRADLTAACDHSLLPGLCRLQAGLYYRAVRRYGAEQYGPITPMLNAPAMFIGNR